MMLAHKTIGTSDIQVQRTLCSAAATAAIVGATRTPWQFVEVERGQKVTGHNLFARRVFIVRGLYVFTVNLRVSLFFDIIIAGI